jgi:hypothetical protein
MHPEPDVEIAVAVRAEQLRFTCKPEIDVVAYSNLPATAASTSERENLPDTFEEGVTYRDVAVRWRVAVRLEDPESTS